MGDDLVTPETTGNRPPNKPLRSRLGGVAMLPLSLLIACGTVWWVVHVFNNTNFDDDAAVRSFILFLIFASLFMVLAVRLVGIGRQLMAPDAEQVLAHDKRDPVVYLRPFAEDTRVIYALPLGKRNGGEKIVNRPVARAAHEHLLKHELQHIGPFVAVGKPGDKLAPLGAARFYLAENEWQEKVDAQLRSNRALSGNRRGHTVGSGGGSAARRSPASSNRCTESPSTTTGLCPHSGATTASLAGATACRLPRR